MCPHGHVFKQPYRKALRIEEICGEICRGLHERLQAMKTGVVNVVH